MTKKGVNVTVNADDSWAEVELFRWQYGELPFDNRPLDISAGLEAMAKAIEDGCESGGKKPMPSPYNVVMVLEYCARKLRIH